MEKKEKKYHVRVQPVLETLPEECGECVYRTLHKLCHGTQAEVNICPRIVSEQSKQSKQSKLNECDFN